MKRLICLSVLILPLCMWADINIQAYYDFGTKWSKMPNQQTQCIHTTLEMGLPDAWGSTYGKFDFDYSLARKFNSLTTPQDCAMRAYWEIARNLNFWRDTKASGLNVHFEYNGGLGLYDAGLVTGGYAINHRFLIGAQYFLTTPDDKNHFSFLMAFKIIVDEHNNYLKWESESLMVPQKGNEVPGQISITWDCKDFCTLKGLTFRGYTDLWGQKLCIYNPQTQTTTDSKKQSFVWLMEPELWYSVGQWFKCPQLHIGGEFELSYNYRDMAGFLFIPRVGLVWVFN